jgi:AbrB family looped-hinge helix DNA binding protein
MELTSLSTKGQIVIPEQVRKRFKLKAGNRLVLFERGNELVLRKEEDVEKELKSEHESWNALSLSGLKDIWDNPEDERVWKNYL